jgi:uncharacterized LabA/DUF88 family protein
VKTNIYVDGFNLYYGAVKGTPYKWLDLLALSAKLFRRNQINRIRYFTAIVDARPPDVQQPVRQQTYLRALHTIPSLSVHLGTFRTRPVRMTLVHPPRFGPRTAEVWKTEEKGSDVNLASYLLLDAFRRDCDVAIVFSNDADLKEPIDIVKNELGIKVGVVNPHPPARRSLDLQPTFFKQLRRGPIAACQFPAVMTDAQGQFQKPASW